jgi:hypothetical protein
MQFRWVRFALALGGVVAGAILWPMADASASGPSVNLSAQFVKSGATIAVLGVGFGPYEDVSVSLCGADGQDGSAGCDLNDQVTLQTDKKGDLGTPLRVEIPPTPCPCAVVVDTGDRQLTAPISIQDAPSSPLVPTKHIGMPVLNVTGAQLSGTGPWTSWFGGPATRTLTFTLRNSGPGVLASSPMVLHLSSWLGGTVAIKAPNTGFLQAGQSRTYRVHIDLGPFAVGQFRLKGDIATFGNGATFQTSTFAFPIGLLLGALLVVQVILLAVRNFLRRRRERNHTPDQDRVDPITNDLPIIEAPTQPVARV